MVEVHAEAVPWEALRLEIEREEATLQTFRNLAGAEQGEIHGMQGAIREQVAKISELKQELQTRRASYKSARRGVGGEGGGPQGATPSVHLPAGRAAGGGGGGGGGRSPPVTPPRTSSDNALRELCWRATQGHWDARPEDDWPGVVVHCADTSVDVNGTMPMQHTMANGNTPLSCAVEHNQVAFAQNLVG